MQHFLILTNIILILITGCGLNPEKFTQNHDLSDTDTLGQNDENTIALCSD